MAHSTIAPFAANSYFEGVPVSDPLSSLSALAEPVTNRQKSQGLIVVLYNILTFVLLCNQLLF